MGESVQVAKDPDMCLSCKTMPCTRISATHWCPILSEKAKKNLSQKRDK